MSTRQGKPSEDRTQDNEAPYNDQHFYRYSVSIIGPILLQRFIPVLFAPTDRDCYMAAVSVQLDVTQEYRRRAMNPLH